MIFESIVNCNIKKELDAIATSHKGFMEKEIFFLDDVEAFTKTETYKSFRQGKLADDQISFMLNSYSYRTDELTSLIASKIRNLNITKLISIGALSYMLQQRDIRNSSGRNLEYYLLGRLEIKKPREELKELLEFFSYRRRNGMTTMSDIALLKTMLKTFWFGLSEDFIKEGSSIKRYEGLNLIEEQYSTIYDLLVKPKKSDVADIKYLDFISSNVSTVPFEGEHNRPASVDIIERSFFTRSYDSNSFSRNYKTAWKNTSKNVYTGNTSTSEILEILTDLPYVDLKFVIDKANNTKDFKAIDKIYLMVSAVCMSKLNPLVEFDKNLQMIEQLHSMWGLEIKLIDFLKLAVTNDGCQMDYFINSLLKEKSLSKDRKAEIYEIYFKNEDSNFSPRDVDHKIQAMMFLEIGDSEIADFIQKAINRGTHLYEIKKHFPCSTIDINKYSYPGIKTLKVIIKQELLMHRAAPFTSRGELEDNTDKLFEEYYFNDRNFMDSNALITWKMANSPDFLKKCIKHMSTQGRRLNKTIAKFNLANIGYNRYIMMIEDYHRKNNIRKFARTSKNALRFATDSEIFMYKLKLDTNMLASSSNLDFKTLSFLLDRADRKNISRQESQDMRYLIAGGVARNKKLSNNEMAEILSRLGVGGVIRRLFYSDRTDYKINSIRISFQSVQKMSVEDFSNYYDSLEGVK